MRLLQVIQSVDPAGGGVIEAVRLFAICNKEMGGSMEVVSLDSPDAEFVREFPIPVHAMGPGSLGKYSYSPRLLPWLRENAHNYDCLIVNGLWQYHCFAVHRALAKTRTPYVVFPHGMLDPWFKHQYPLKHLKKWLYWPWSDYRLLRDAGAVLFTCEEEMRLAPESFWLYRLNPVVVGFGTLGPELDLPELDLDEARNLFLGEHPELRGKRVALFLGRIHPKKGCDLLIEAFASKLAADPDWHLLMVGPDQVGWQAELRKQAEALGIANRVTWVGMAAGARKWGAFRCAEVFVLPSHQENFGIVVAEALACSVPVLISNKINIWREVLAAGAGLVESDTLEGTEALLQRWNTLPAEGREELGKRCLAAFQNNFDIQANAKSILQAIESVMAQSQTDRRVAGRSEAES